MPGADPKKDLSEAPPSHCGGDSWCLRQKIGPVDVVTVLPDRFDANLAREFSRTVKEMIGSGSRTVLLDLGRVDFIDSYALGSMVQCLKRLREISDHPGRLALCAVQNKVMSLFSLTRMDRVFPIYYDRNTALQTLAAKT